MPSSPADAPSARSLTWRAKLLALLFSTAFALVVAEVAWRTWRTPGYGPTTNPYYVQHDDRLGWRYRPDSEVRHATEDFDVPIRINARGQRDALVPFERTPGRDRIVLLGDSLTFGWGVREEESFASGLESRLDCEVVNLAVSGYGTDQELLWLKAEGLRYRPDVVIVTVCANDIEECSRERMYGKAKPRFVLENGSPRLVVDRVEQSWLAATSHLYRSIAGKLRAALQPPLSSAQVISGQALVRALLRDMDAVTRSEGARLLVVSEGATWLGEGSIAESDIPHLDLAGLLKSTERVRGAVRFEHDSHWTALGHEVVAEGLASKLEELGWLR